jgi:hypothetical protein
MPDTPQQQQKKQVQINTGDEILRGRFTNSMLISHNAEEFIIDWLLNSPSGAHIVSRIIVTPGHIKRIISALQENLNKYESHFGPVTPAEDGRHEYH